MLKRIGLLIIVSCMMMVAGLTLGQGNEQADEWESLIYVRDKIIRVTADGLGEPIPLPQPARTFRIGNQITSSFGIAR